MDSDLGDLDILPIEIVQSILLFLDARTIAECREVCTSFCMMIDGSSSTNYAIKLAQHGLFDHAHALPAGASERLALLTNYLDSWASLKDNGSMTDYEFSSQAGNLWELFGNILAQLNSSGDIVMRRLPSPSLGREEEMWTVNVSDVRLRDFGQDPSQDLLVLIEAPMSWLGTSDMSHKIHLRTVSTGRKHPLAKEATLRSTVDNADPQMSYGIQVCGDYFAVHFKGTVQETYIVVWNWKTGVKKTHIVGHEMGSFAFLSETHLVVSVTHPQAITLAIVDFASSDGEVVNFDEMDNLILHLPELRVLAVAYIRCDPSPAWPKSDPTVPFYDNPDQLLYTLSLWTAGGLHFTFIIPRATFLNQIGGNSTQTSDIPWEDWGPRGTRILDSDNHSPPSAVWSCTTFGSMMVSFDPDHFCVNLFDFNRLRVKQEVTSDHGVRQINPNDVLDLPEDDYEQPAVCLRETVLYPESHLTFKSIVRTSLPFRARAIPIDLPEGQWSVMRSQNNVVLVNGSGREFRILSF